MRAQAPEGRRRPVAPRAMLEPVPHPARAVAGPSVARVRAGHPAVARRAVRLVPAPWAVSAWAARAGTWAAAPGAPARLGSVWAAFLWAAVTSAVKRDAAVVVVTGAEPAAAALRVAPAAVPVALRVVRVTAV